MRTFIVITILAVLVAGCGIADGYNDQRGKGDAPVGGESWGGAAALDLFLSALMMHGARRVTVRCSPEYSGLVEGIGKRRQWHDLGLMTVEVGP